MQITFYRTYGCVEGGRHNLVSKNQPATTQDRLLISLLFLRRCLPPADGDAHNIVTIIQLLVATPFHIAAGFVFCILDPGRFSVLANKRRRGGEGGSTRATAKTRSYLYNNRTCYHTRFLTNKREDILTRLSALPTPIERSTKLIIELDNNKPEQQ